ncbi:MAG: CYTH domain-containing protein [Bacteroidota bacterium]
MCGSQMPANHQEIERKFIVRHLPAGCSACPSVEMRQGYVVIDDARALSVRIRQEDSAYRLTIKQGRGRIRTEVETPIQEGQFQVLWPLTGACNLEKTRFYVEEKGKRLEVDVYGGLLSPLKMLEVEFDSIEEASEFMPPEWASEEVTEDPRFLNQNLARYGIPD